MVRCHAPISQIKIIDLSKQNIPNRFYYACPDGIIDLKDVPDYAGLIWINENAARIIKQAPFITKENIFSRIMAVLLEKFWYLSERQRCAIRNIQINKA
jgi:hypothetical protein